MMSSDGADGERDQAGRGWCGSRPRWPAWTGGCGRRAMRSSGLKVRVGLLAGRLGGLHSLLARVAVDARLRRRGSRRSSRRPSPSAPAACSSFFCGSLRKRCEDRPGRRGRGLCSGSFGVRLDELVAVALELRRPVSPRLSFWNSSHRLQLVAVDVHPGDDRRRAAPGRSCRAARRRGLSVCWAYTQKLPVMSSSTPAPSSQRHFRSRLVSPSSRLKAR